MAPLRITANAHNSFITLITTLYIYAFVMSLSAFLECRSPYECSNQSHNITNLHLQGYKSAFGPTTSITGNRANCYGAFSCAYTQFIHLQHELLCYGASSCINTTITANISNIGTVRCGGSNACMFSNITTYYLICYGYESCAYSHIYFTNTIWAVGLYSLYGAIINIINGSNTISVRLSGDYSGYGATLLCPSDNQCDIYCNGYSSCFMFYVDCIGNCTFYNRSAHTILPITNISEFRDIFQFDMITLSNDEDCNTAFDSLGYYNNESDIIITDHREGAICCRGMYACYRVNRIEYQSGANGNIICSGYYACIGSNMVTNNGSIFCEGLESCQSLKISNVTSVYCMGSCGGSIITHSQQIVCAGLSSCSRTILRSEGADLSVYFNGDHSGENAQIYCNSTDLCDIICGGNRGCLNTTLICDGVCTVQCNEESECPLVWSASPSAHPTSLPTLYPSIHPTLYPTVYPTSLPTFYPTAITVYPSMHPTSYPSSSLPTLYPTLYPTAYSTSLPTLHPTLYPSSSLPTIDMRVATTKYTITSKTTERTLPPKKQDDIVLAIVLAFVSISLLSVCGAVIWYWNQRRNAKRIFTNAQLQGSNNSQQKDGNKIDENVKGNAQKKDDSDDSIEKLYDNKPTDGMAQGDSDDSDASIQKLYDNKGTDGATVPTTCYGMTHDDVKKDGETDDYKEAPIQRRRQLSLLDEIEGIHKTEEDNEDDYLQKKEIEQIIDIYVKEEIEPNNGECTQTTNDRRAKALEEQTLDYYDKELIKQQNGEQKRDFAKDMNDENDDDIDDIYVKAELETESGKEEGYTQTTKDSKLKVLEKEKQTLSYYDRHLIK